MNNEERIYRELISEESSHWFISDKYGKKILFKLPTSTIKSIIFGCRIQLIFGIDEQPESTYMLVGVRIFDDPTNYIDVIGLQRFQFEHDSLISILESEDVYVEFYNEINICTASAVLRLQSDQREILKCQIEKYKFYVGDFTSLAQSSLDRFSIKLGHVEATITEDLKIIFLDCSIYDINKIYSYFYGENEVGTYNIEAEDGGALENLVWASIQGVFGRDVYKNPIIVKNTKKRELTDIFAFHEYGYFIIETKALSIIETTWDKNIKKKINGVKKQIIKGTKQIIGAVNAIRQNYQIMDKEGNEIVFKRLPVPHGVILVSELFPICDWSDIKTLLFKTMMEENIYLNLLDLKEFTKFTLPFKDQTALFDFNLMERVKACVDNDAIFISGRLKKGTI